MARLGMGLAASLVVLLPIFPSFAGKEDADFRYVRISEVRYLMDDEQKVGPLKVGVLCLPNGSLRWGEVKLPSESEVRADIAARLEKAGTSLRVVAQSATETRGDVAQLRVAVESATFHLCMPGMQMLAGKPKLRGTVKIRWEMTEKGVAPAHVYSSTIAVDESSDPRRSATPLLHAFAESAEQFSRTLTD